MKAIDIAFKDLTRSFRSAFSVIFMFGVPLRVTGMFYLMFGNMAKDIRRAILAAGCGIVRRFGAIRAEQVVRVAPVDDRLVYALGGIRVQAADVLQKALQQHLGAEVDVDLRRLVDRRGGERDFAIGPGARHTVGEPHVRQVARARQLEGIARHASVHAAGVVIAPRPLTEFVPLYKSQKDEIVTQWAMNEVVRVGLLKMDFLGLSTLTLIDDALAQIAATSGDRIAMADVPLTDAKTFDLFCEGQTLGIFQFESAGMRQILRQAKPRKFEDLIALNAEIKA